MNDCLNQAITGKCLSVAPTLGINYNVIIMIPGTETGAGEFHAVGNRVAQQSAA
jgi:hypothetical protein